MSTRGTFVRGLSSKTTTNLFWYHLLVHSIQCNILSISLVSSIVHCHIFYSVQNSPASAVQFMSCQTNDMPMNQPIRHHVINKINWPILSSALAFPIWNSCRTKCFLIFTSEITSIRGSSDIRVLLTDLLETKICFKILPHRLATTRFHQNSSHTHRSARAYVALKLNSILSSKCI